VQQLNTKRLGGLLAAALAIAALTLSPGQPAAEAHERSTPAAAHDEAPASSPRHAGAARGLATGEDYAAREANAPDLAKFEGGDRVVVFASSTVIIVLLVVLILVIL
jgi:hypothetical protein